jgi:hypothetical protein
MARALLRLRPVLVHRLQAQKFPLPFRSIA